MNWKFWKRGTKNAAPDADSIYRHELFAWEQRMIVHGFRLYLAEMPPFGVPLELMRRTWPTIHIANREDLRPEFNVADLWWRYANGPMLQGTTGFDLSLMPPQGSA